MDTTQSGLATRNVARVAATSDPPLADAAAFSMTSVKVFVGGLPHDITPRELREALPEIPMLGDPIIRSWVHA